MNMAKYIVRMVSDSCRKCDHDHSTTCPYLVMIIMVDSAESIRERVQ